jgi:hypothetical protein
MADLRKEKPESLPDTLKLKQWGQRQDSLHTQLEDLYDLAVRLGMYDAADFLARQLSVEKVDNGSDRAFFGLAPGPMQGKEIE